MGEQWTDCSDLMQRQLEGSLGIEHDNRNQVSAGPIEYPLAEGWVCIGFFGRKAHYLIRDDSVTPVIWGGKRVIFYDTACGMELAQTQDMLFHPGTWQKCKRCLRARQQRGES